MTDIEAAPPPSDAELSRVAALAIHQQHLEHKIALALAELERLKDALRQVSEIDLPEAMGAVNVETFTAKGGIKVSISRIIRASIPKDRRTEALAWLDANGHGAITKSEITAAFSKGQEPFAKEALTLLRSQRWANSVDIAENRYVHHSTLGAFVREQINTIPHDLFGVHIQRLAKIETPAAAPGFPV